MKKHPVTSQLLGAYVDGELSAGESSRVREHLLECESCRKEEGALRRMSTLIKSARTSDEPVAGLEGLSRSVLSRIERSAYRSIRTSVSDWWFGIAGSLRWGSAVGVGVVVVALIVFQFVPGTGPELVSQVTPSSEPDLEVETGVEDANILVYSSEDATVVWVQGPGGA